MLFVYPTAQYPRRALEYVFKGLYHLSNLFHAVSLIVIITDFYTKLSDSMPEYYTNSDLVVSPSISMIMDSCTYRGTVKLGNVRGTIDVGYGTIQLGLMSTAQYVTALFVVEFLIIVNSVVSALNYTTGNRHLRFFGVHVPLYHITIFFAYFYSITIIVLTWVYDNDRHLFKDAVVYCANQLRHKDPQRLLEAEYDDYNIFTTAVYWPFAATCFALFVYFMAVATLCWNSWDKATVLLSEADAPWEQRGPLCATSKPLLKLHTAQRKAIIKDARQAIKDGEKVRIVRSYQLMTEEDFSALVQAMRDRHAQAVKEKQFEMLQRHFGDDVGQIDQTGFHWRQRMAGAMPSPTEGQGGEGGDGADQFYDVEFEDYFTDNNNNNQNGEEGIDGEYSPYVEGDLPEGGEEDYGYDEEDPDAPWVPPQGGEDWGGEDDVYNEAGDEPDHGHRRRHRRPRRSRNQAADDGYMAGEPDPQNPSGYGHEYPYYSPAEGFDGYDNNNNNPRSGSGGRRGGGGGGGGGSRHRGRQAEVDDDYADADALSDNIEHYHY